MVIIKNRSSSPNGQWVVGQDAYTGFTGQMYLNTTGAFSSNSGSFANTAPTSSVVTINTDNTVNEGTDDFVMYCFHSVEGYSKIGSYRGNSSTDGTFVYTGFRPAWLMIRNASNGGAWCIFDNKQNPDNAVNLMLLADQNVTTSGGGTGDNLDFLSNGFKLRDNSGGRNTSSQTYIYMAIAEADFKTSNAR